MAQHPKAEAHIYVNKESRATQEVTNFISKNLDAINQSVRVRVVYINDSVKKTLISKGITTVPAMILGGKIYVTADVIIRALTPVRRRVDDLGLAVTNPEELIQRDMLREMANKNDQESDIADNRDAEIKRKMSEMQQRRPVMAGFKDSPPPLPGGRPIKQNSEPMATYDTDAAFIQASRRDNIGSTPIGSEYTELDGLAALEEYRNVEADRNGRVHKGGRGWRRPAA